MQSSPVPVILFLFGSNIFLSILFSNTLGLRSLDSMVSCALTHTHTHARTHSTC